MTVLEGGLQGVEGLGLRVLCLEYKGLFRGIWEGFPNWGAILGPPNRDLRIWGSISGSTGVYEP